MLPRQTLSSGLSALLRSVAVACGRLAAVANAETTGREQGSNENPLLRIGETYEK